MEFIYDFLAGSSSQNIAANGDLSRTRDKSLRDTTAAYLWFCKKKRRCGPLLYNRPNFRQNFFSNEHPSKYSSYNYIKQIKQDPPLIEEKDLFFNQKVHTSSTSRCSQKLDLRRKALFSHCSSFDDFLSISTLKKTWEAPSKSTEKTKRMVSNLILEKNLMKTSNIVEDTVFHFVSFDYLYF